MLKKPKPTDFLVDVADIGSFVFARRTMADEIKIQVEYADMIAGVPPTQWLSDLCGWISVLRVLTVSAPKDWNIDEMDPLEKETYENLMLVFLALRSQEETFRKGKREGSEKASKVPVNND